MTVSEEQLLRSITGVLGRDESTPAERRALQLHMCDHLDAILADFGIPGGVHARTSVYLGPRRPFLFHMLNRVFRSEGDPLITREEAQRLHDAYALVEPIYSDLSLFTVVILREHDSGLLMHGSGRVDTYLDGGLDGLGREMRRMTFLPDDVRREWSAIPPYMACERSFCREVHPASIPMRHQPLAYAGMLRLREDIFRSRVTDTFGADAPAMLDGLTVPQRRAWTQLTFGRQGGHEFRPARRGSAAALAAEASQFAGDHAGLNTLLTALKDSSAAERYEPTLASIFTNTTFSRMASVRIARVRAAEAELLERLNVLPRATVATH